MALASGSSFGVYRIIEPLGRGGMASVYKAYEASLDRYVALKVLPAEFLHDETFAERFRREAKLIARLEHPRIVPIHAFGIEGGIPWMAMRLIPGGALASLLRGSRLPDRRVMAVLTGVAEALDYAHEKGVVHRDIKPQNVLLDEAERVYLADFGIARMVEGSPAITRTGMITGTPQYMAPEQATGVTADRRCDIYSLGVVAYEMVTGRVPFAADTPVAVLMKHALEPIPLPPAEQVPEPVMRPILRALAKRPEDRWPTASEFASAVVRGLTEAATAVAAPATVALERVEAPPPTVALPRTVSGRATTAGAAAPVAVEPEGPERPPAARRPARWAAVGALLALAGAAAVVLSTRSKTTSVEPTTPAPTPAPISTPSSPAMPPGASSPGSSPATPSPSAATPLARRLPATETRVARATPQPQPMPVRPPTPASAIGEERRPPPAAVPQIPAAPRETPTPAPPAVVATGTLRLDVDAVRDPFDNAANTLQLRVAIDDRVVREVTIAFTGKDAFERARRRQPVDVPDVPIGKRRVTLEAVPQGAEPAPPFKGTTELQIVEGSNRAYVQVRYLRRDREVRFR